MTIIASITSWTITSSYLLKNSATTIILTWIRKTWIDYINNWCWTWTNNTSTDRSRSWCNYAFTITTCKRIWTLTKITSCCRNTWTTIITRKNIIKKKMIYWKLLLPWIRYTIITSFTTWTIITWCTWANKCYTKITSLVKYFNRNLSYLLDLLVYMYHHSDMAGKHMDLVEELK